MQAECEERLLVLCASNTGDIEQFTQILSQPRVDPNVYDEVFYQQILLRQYVIYMITPCKFVKCSSALLYSKLATVYLHLKYNSTQLVMDTSPL